MGVTYELRCDLGDLSAWRGYVGDAVAASIANAGSSALRAIRTATSRGIRDRHRVHAGGTGAGRGGIQVDIHARHDGTHTEAHEVSREQHAQYTFTQGNKERRHGTHA